MQTIPTTSLRSPKFTSTLSLSPCSKGKWVRLPPQPPWWSGQLYVLPLLCTISVVYGRCGVGGVLFGVEVDHLHAIPPAKDAPVFASESCPFLSPEPIVRRESFDKSTMSYRSVLLKKSLAFRPWISSGSLFPSSPRPVVSTPQWRPCPVRCECR